MRMQLPAREEFRISPSGRDRSDIAVEKEWEQASRQRWRTLANAIKAKLAMIDDGISSVERKFLSDIVLPDGRSVGEMVGPQLDGARLALSAG